MSNSMGYLSDNDLEFGNEFFLISNVLNRGVGGYGFLCNKPLNKGLETLQNKPTFSSSTKGLFTWGEGNPPTRPKTHQL